MKTILLTGASGAIGRSLQQHLDDSYKFRCIDRQPLPEVEDSHVIDVTDFSAVAAVMAGVDAVIHLAANPHVDQAWNDVYTSGIGGTYNVFEAARQANVRKIIYASTNHVSGWREVLGESPITPDLPVRPDSLYGVGKAFGEALGQFYCDRYEVSVICLRIGTFTEDPQARNSEDRILRTWCSPRDLAQLVARSLEVKNLGFQIFYGISGNTRRFWDIGNAQELLGYRPQDNAEVLLKPE